MRQYINRRPHHHNDPHADYQQGTQATTVKKKSTNAQFGMNNHMVKEKEWPSVRQVCQERDVVYSASDPAKANHFYLSRGMNLYVYTLPCRMSSL